MKTLEVDSRAGIVASADVVASQAGIDILRAGGNAVDAAIATNAVMAVVAPHLCGIGGDLFALVHLNGEVAALDASGRAGAGASAAQLRDEGFTSMPFRHDIRSVTIPGCVDGWLALHERFGSLPLDVLLYPAIQFATGGFSASPLLAGSVALLDERGRTALEELTTQATAPGARVVRRGVARALSAIASEGRAGFYLGEFGDGLNRLGHGWFAESDFATPGSSWVTPLTHEVFGHRVWTMPPASQGYLILGSLGLAEQVGVPVSTTDAQWAHVLIESATAAGRDRPERLFDGGDGVALLADVLTRHGEIDLLHASDRWSPSQDGDTTYLCVIDDRGMGVSLIQSNASGFGSFLVEPSTGINLHNRGLGFSLRSEHPAELWPGKRPPHTLCPALITRRNDSLRAVVGTMGGDGQPQILQQVITRLLHHEVTVGAAINAPRWVLRGPTTGFDTWTNSHVAPTVQLEGHAENGWTDGLVSRGHRVQRTREYDSNYGHAQAIVVNDDGSLSGAADPRTVVGAALSAD